MATHFIITNRQVSDQEGEGFFPVNNKEFIRADGDEEAHHGLRYGEVHFDPAKAELLNDFEINIYPDPKQEDLEEYTEGVSLDPEKISGFGSRKVFDKLYNTCIKEKDHSDILVFVHGFSSDLLTSLETLKDLHIRYVEPESSPIKHIVLFTWPAKKKTLKYRRDSEDTNNSGFALARSFASLREYFQSKFVKEKKSLCKQNIHLMCHSTGNSVLESMLAALKEIGIEPNSIFSEIFLVGADIDYDALEKPKPLYRIIDLGQRVHVYYHNHDQALGISELSKSAFNKLGRWGAKNSLSLADDIYQCNVSDIQDDEKMENDVAHHWYFINSNSVTKDIIDVLNGKGSVFNF